MKEPAFSNGKINLSLIMSGISLVTALILAACHISGRYMLNMSTDNFIAITVALLGIIVTFVVGFQIVNVLDIKNKIKRIEQLESEIEKEQETIRAIRLLLQAQIIQKRRPDEAVSLYNEVLRIDQNNETALLQRGILHKKSGNYQLALADLQTLANSNSNDPKVYHNIGSVYLLCKCYDKAFEFYHKAITIDPKHIDSYVNMGYAYQEIGRYKEALKSYDKAIDLKTTSYAHIYKKCIYKKQLERARNQEDMDKYRKLIRKEEHFIWEMIEENLK